MSRTMVEADRGAGPSVHIRVSTEMMDQIRLISEWADRGHSDLIKEWIRQGIEHVVRQKSFGEWVKKKM